MLVENLSVPTDRRVWLQATTLQEEGYQICIICPRGITRDREAYVRTNGTGISIYRYRLPITGRSRLTYIAEYTLALCMTFLLSLKVLFLQGFDVIHTANPPDLFFLIGLFYRFLGKQFVFDQHDLAPEIFRARYGSQHAWLYTWLLLCERWSYQLANVVIVTNTSQYDKAITRGGCSPDKVIIVRNGPDLTHFKPGPAEPELKKGQRFLLVYVGIMNVQDGLEYALQALAELVHQRGRRDVLLVLLGEGAAVPFLKTLTRQLQLDDYVHFNGWTDQEDILRYLNTADICLAPDPANKLNEFSTMLKIMEYMAISKPIVAFDLKETRFSAQQGALYARPNDSADFANKIEVLLDDEVRRQTTGVSGRKRIVEELSWEHSRPNLLRAYSLLASRRAGPSAISKAQSQEV